MYFFAVLGVSMYSLVLCTFAFLLNRRSIGITKKTQASKGTQNNRKTQAHKTTANRSIQNSAKYRQAYKIT
jgi:hypothetical protein